MDRNLASISTYEYAQPKIKWAFRPEASKPRYVKNKEQKD